MPRPIMLLILLGLAGPAAAAEAPVPPSPGDALIEDLRLSCVKKLEALRDPIRRYELEKGELPEWLSDLRREGFVSDSTAFLCPITEQVGAVPDLALYFPDPLVPGSYLYEWNPTMREWRNAQRNVVGGKVPLVRCVLHEKVLNLGVDGDLFESELSWEAGPVERHRSAGEWVGRSAPDFTLPDLQGKSVSLADHRGRDVVVLDFWATWCGPCLQAFPTLQKLESEYAGRGVTFYAVNLGETTEKVRLFLERQRLDLRVLFDARGETARTYGVTGIPRTMVIGRDGAVKGVRVGFAMDYAEATRRDLEDALKEP